MSYDEMAKELLRALKLGEGNANENDEISSQTEAYIDPLFSIVLRFQLVSEKYLKKKKEQTMDAIRRHLLEFGGVHAKKSYEYKSEIIENICEMASEFLTSHHYLASDKVISRNEHRPFQRKWLINMKRLLPQSKEVMAVLPWLLTCYTINIPKNRLDPFDGGSNEFTSGWTDIFQDKANNRKALLNEGAGNRSKSIDALCRYFQVDYKSKYCALFYDESIVLVEVRKDRKSERTISPTTLRGEKADCWEYYRRFAAFCVACEKYPEVNMSLSLALFVSMWDFGIGYDFEGTCEEKVGQYSCYVAGEGTGKQLLAQYSEEDLEADQVRKKVLELMKREPTEDQRFASVHEIAMITSHEDAEPKKFEKWDSLEKYFFDDDVDDNDSIF